MSELGSGDDDDTVFLAAQPEVVTFVDSHPKTHHVAAWLTILALVTVAIACYILWKPEKPANAEEISRLLTDTESEDDVHVSSSPV